MTVEDPIEFLHRHKSCVVNQRELGSDAQSFALALKSALRQDPDVILVGEMRDLETMSTAITAAETGHLVFATLHTQDTAQTVDRIVDSFPPAQQHQVRTQLSIALQGIVTQQLLPTADGKGRVCACEVHGADAGRPQPRSARARRTSSTRRFRPAARTACRRWTPSLADLVRGGMITRAARRVALVHARGAQAAARGQGRRGDRRTAPRARPCSRRSRSRRWRTSASTSAGPARLGRRGGASSR